MYSITYIPNHYILVLINKWLLLEKYIFYFELTTGRFFKNNEGGLRGVRQPMEIDYLPMTLKWIVWGVWGGEGCSNYRSF